MIIKDCKLLVFLQFLIMYNAKPILLTNVTEVVTHIISYSFEDFHCIYFIRDDVTESSILIDTLMHIQIPIVVFFLDKRDNEIKSVAPQCNGYIIVTGTTELLTYLFKEDDLSLIKPHKRTVIFFQRKIDLRKSPLEYAAFIRGMDIITVEGLQEDISFGLNSLIDSNKFQTRDYLRITSLRNNKTLISWNSIANLLFSEEIFKKTPWVPKFEYNSTIYKLKISAFNYWPYILCDPQNGVTDGIEYRILKDLINKWPVEFIIITKNLPGLNQWNTALVDITTKSSTIALGSHWMYAIDGVDTDISVPYGHSCATFLVPKPKKINPTVFVLQPLNLTLWIIIITVSSILAVLFHVVAVCYKEMGSSLHPYVDINLTMLDVISSCTTSALHYLHITSSRIHLRILLLMLCIHSLLFFTAYLTGYASLLTYPRFSKPTRTYEDIVTNKIHWECKNDYYSFALRNSTFAIFRQLADLQDINKSMTTLNYRIRHNDIAFAADTVNYGYVAETEIFDDYAKSHLKLLGSCFFDRYVTMRIVKDSPFTELINTRITRIFESGLIRHWDMEMRHRLGERYVANFHSEFVTEVVVRNPLTIENMQGAFYLLFIGYVLSTAVLVIERQIFS